MTIFDSIMGPNLSFALWTLIKILMIAVPVMLCVAFTTLPRERSLAISNEIGAEPGCVFD